jgi:hypothetical protein
MTLLALNGLARNILRQEGEPVLLEPLLGRKCPNNLAASLSFRTGGAGNATPQGTGCNSTVPEGKRQVLPLSLEKGRGPVQVFGKIDTALEPSYDGPDGASSTGETGVRRRTRSRGLFATPP